MKIFQTVRRRLRFISAPVEELSDHKLDALIQAATSKCVEFNIVANRTTRHAETAFILMSNLRGLCEDLIYLTYLSRMEKQNANELIKLLLAQNISEGLTAQRKFFDANNPFQPVLDSGLSADKAEQQVKEARNKLRNFWKAMQYHKPDGPTVREMAEGVGLKSTYEFIYFSASNFVHFNPHTLFRTGWGAEHGLFTFSIRNMSEYYQSFSSFYGAVLFIGFQASFGADHYNVALDTEIERLIELIGHVQRWPEIITFEEMNQKPPSYLPAHVLGKLMREDGITIPYGAILQEVQGLKRPKDTP
ncbi:MAG: DUF5677 domain-containing protein [Nitrospira sp.]|nr:DUF5677 domain-containing protein [Nitrospira sp.]